MYLKIFLWRKNVAESTSISGILCKTRVKLLSVLYTETLDFNKRASLLLTAGSRSILIKNLRTISEST